MGGDFKWSNPKSRKITSIYTQSVASDMTSGEHWWGGGKVNYWWLLPHSEWTSIVHNLFKNNLLCHGHGFQWRIQASVLVISFIFMQFSANILPNNRFAYPLPLPRIGAPRLGNPRSANGNLCKRTPVLNDSFKTSNWLQRTHPFAPKIIDSKVTKIAFYKYRLERAVSYASFLTFYSLCNLLRSLRRRHIWLKECVRPHVLCMYTHVQVRYVVLARTWDLLCVELCGDEKSKTAANHLNYINFCVSHFFLLFWKFNQGLSIYIRLDANYHPLVTMSVKTNNRLVGTKQNVNSSQPSYIHP